MPYSDTKTQLRKDLAAGKFQQEGKGFLSDVADMYMDYALRSMLAEESDERAAKKAAEKDRKTKIANSIKEAKAKEAQARDYQRKATNLLRDVGFSEQLDNPNFMKVAMEQIYAAEGNYNSALTRMETLKSDGRLKVLGPMQGPAIPGRPESLDIATASTSRAIDAELADTGTSETAETILAMTDGQPGQQNFKNALEEQMAGIMEAQTPVSEVSGFRSELRSSESSGDPTAVDFNKEDGKDHAGLYQFGQDRLNEINNALGTNYTVEDIKAGNVSENEQERLADWHFADIDKFIEDKGLDKFIGTEINGATVTRAGMAAVAHLGGKGGLEQFLLTDGAVDPSDGRTKLSDYMKRFEQSQYTETQMDELGLDPNQQGLMIAPITPPDTSTEYMKGLNSVNEIIGRKAQVLADPKLPVKKQNDLIERLDKAMAEMIAQKEADAAKNQEPQLYGLRNKDGKIVAGQLIRGIRVDGGIKRSGDNTVMEGDFVYIPEDSVESVIKYNNDTVEQITVQMASDANLARDIVDLRDIIVQNPAITNRFAVGASQVSTFLKEGVSAVASLMEEDQEYSYEQAVGLLDRIEDLTPQRREAEMLKLRVAYGLARLQGSSGMSLSDKELKAQLDSVLANGDPAKALSLLNRQLKSLVESSETTRKTRVSGFFDPEGAGDVFGNAIWNQSMDDYIRGEIGEDRLQSYDDALAGNTDYNLPPAAADPVEDPVKAIEDWSNGSVINGIASKSLMAAQVERIRNAEGLGDNKAQLVEELYEALLADFRKAGFEQLTMQSLKNILEPN